MKTNKQKANDFSEIFGHMLANGLKVGFVLFGGLTVMLFILIYSALKGHFEIGLLINSLGLLSLGLTLRKIKKKKENF